MYLLVTSTLIQANDTIPEVIPEGWWNVAQVTVEKKTDGIDEKNVYVNAADVKSDIPCPQEWLIILIPSGIVLRYADESEKTCYYEVKDDKLIMIFDDGTTQSYQYELKDEELILTTIYEQPVKNAEQNTEHWTITLKKQEHNTKD